MPDEVLEASEDLNEDPVPVEGVDVPDDGEDEVVVAPSRLHEEDEAVEVNVEGLEDLPQTFEPPEETEEEEPAVPNIRPYPPENIHDEPASDEPNRHLPVQAISEVSTTDLGTLKFKTGNKAEAIAWYITHHGVTEDRLDTLDFSFERIVDDNGKPVPDELKHVSA